MAQGYGGTSMESVARRAGFSKRTVYLYFKNKDDLFISVASEGIEVLQGMLEALDVESAPVEALITATMQSYLRFAAEEPDFFRMIFREATTEMMERASAPVRARVAGQERACLGVVERIVERGIAEGVIPEVDPLETAVVFWGTCTGIILLSLGGSQTVFTRRTREELMSAAVQVLLAGLKVGTPSTSRRER